MCNLFRLFSVVQYVLVGLLRNWSKYGHSHRLGRHHVRLQLTELEPRLVPADYTWTYVGTSPGDWNDPNNWNDGGVGVPGEFDTAWFNQANTGPVSISNSVDVGELILGNVPMYLHANLTVETGGLIAQVVNQDASGANITINGGNLLLDGKGDIQGANGNFATSNTITVTPGGTLEFGGDTNDPTAVGDNINNSGVVTFDNNSSTNFIGPTTNGITTITNNAGSGGNADGDIEINDGALISNSGQVILNNAGTINVNGTASSNVPIVNQASNAVLHVTGGGTLTITGANPTSGYAFAQTAGTTTLDDGATLSLTTAGYSQTGGTLQVNGIGTIDSNSPTSISNSTLTIGVPNVSLGTLNVGTNFTMTNSSWTIDVDANAGTADKIVSGGVVTISNITTTVNLLQGTPTDGQQYTIVQQRQAQPSSPSVSLNGFPVQNWFNNKPLKLVAPNNTTVALQYSDAGE
jgi:hypothetical protein